MRVHTNSRRRRNSGTGIRNFSNRVKCGFQGLESDFYSQCCGVPGKGYNGKTFVAGIGGVIPAYFIKHLFRIDTIIQRPLSDSFNLSSKNTTRVQDAAGGLGKRIAELCGARIRGLPRMRAIGRRTALFHLIEHPSVRFARMQSAVTGFSRDRKFRNRPGGGCFRG